MEKYSSGRRGVPAKDVGRAYPAREFKSLLLRHARKALKTLAFRVFLLLFAIVFSLADASLKLWIFVQFSPFKLMRLPPQNNYLFSL